MSAPGGRAQALVAPVRFARMAGSSLAQPDAAPWVTDFLNATYHRRRADVRRVEDLRLAWLLLTTWQARLGGRRLRAYDLAPVIRAFGLARWRPRRRGWLTLEPTEVLRAGERLAGPWFPAAAADPALRGWGVAFPDAAARAAFDPGARLRHAAVGELTPPAAAEDRQTWHTYPPVRTAAGADALLAELDRADRWPEWASSLGRFTPLRAGAAREGQTFEIDVVAEPLGRVPVLSRGYVTVTRRFGPGRELEDRLATIAEHLDEPPLPRGADARGMLELTTHAGHFLGRAVSRLLAYDHDGAGWIRDVGQWDPLPPHLAATYRLAGRAAQHRFWGPDDPDGSMLAQLALAVDRAV